VKVPNSVLDGWIDFIVPIASNMSKVFSYDPKQGATIEGIHSLADKLALHSP
jgi:hypothetical protein